MKKENTYLSTIAADAVRVAAEYGLGLEIAEYCTAWNMDERFAPVDAVVKKKLERVLQAFSEIKEDSCILTHGGVIAAIMEHLFPGEGRNRYEWQPKPGFGYVIHCAQGTDWEYSSLHA